MDYRVRRKNKTKVNTCSIFGKDWHVSNFRNVPSLPNPFDFHKGTLERLIPNIPFFYTLLRLDEKRKEEAFVSIILLLSEVLFFDLVFSPDSK